MKKLILLGSTGSIGENTLAVVRSIPARVTVVALSCYRRLERLAAQGLEFSPRAVAMVDGAAGAPVPELPGVKIYRGAEGLLRMVEETEADVVINGIAGAAGLLPSLAALRSGKDLILANKESLVIAGSLVLAEAARAGRRIIPVDSEHAALFSILQGLKPETVAELVLTASGGPFRDLSAEALERVTLADALRHPTWHMGAKITVDSASMANKGLEVIEACRLFGMELSRIKVLIHPQSIVHCLVRTVDGTYHAEASTPDMRIPIQNALTYPVVASNAVDWLDLAGRQLSFFAADHGRYPMLELAYHAARLSPSLPIVYNAANEIAVEAFMRGAIRFSAIPVTVERAVSMNWNGAPSTVDDVLAIDAEARARTKEFFI